MSESLRGRLSAEDILSAATGFKSDGNGLFLKVSKSGASWVFRYASGTRRVELGLGAAQRHDSNACKIAAHAAREKALEYSLLLARGIDPKCQRDDKRREQEEREQAKRIEAARERRTLGRVVRQYHEEHVEGHFDDKHCTNWIGRFEKNLKPWKDGSAELWELPIDEVEAQQLADFILHIQKDRPALAKKLRQGLDAVFEWASLKKWCAKNIVQDIRRTTRLKSSRLNKIAARKGWAGMDYREVPDFMKQLRAMDSGAARALQFTVLTACRTNEVLCAQWSEIDLRAGVWVIPAERMKQGIEHRVDLSLAALDVLKKQRELDPDWVFPSPGRVRQALSNMSMLNVLERLGQKGKITVHGFRKSFSTWANEQGIARPDVIEAALAHQDSDEVRRTYNLAKHIDERRELLAKWARYLDGPVDAANEERTEQQVAA